MEKVIKIGNKSVTFKATASTALRYMSQFHTDLLKDMQSADISGDLEQLTPVMNLAYIMAKQANDDITDPYSFFDEFEYIDLISALPDVLHLWASSATSTIKAKKNIVK